jgi:sigma-B regulation protein RsbU (phosphoserine phosphatase)
MYAVAPGDVLLLFTDGVTEADRADGTFFGEDRLGATLAAARGASPPETVRRIAEAVEAFAAGAPQADDITLLCLAFRGDAAASAAGVPAAASA